MRKEEKWGEKEFMRKKRDLGGLLEKRNERQRTKGKIYPSECRVLKNKKER